MEGRKEGRGKEGKEGKGEGKEKWEGRGRGREGRREREGGREGKGMEEEKGKITGKGREEEGEGRERKKEKRQLDFPNWLPTSQVNGGSPVSLSDRLIHLTTALIRFNNRGQKKYCKISPGSLKPPPRLATETLVVNCQLYAEK
ncbi:hypothetical protein L345_05952, partial [Ophiophagus hannah]